MTKPTTFSKDKSFGTVLQHLRFIPTPSVGVILSAAMPLRGLRTGLSPRISGPDSSRQTAVSPPHLSPDRIASHGPSLPTKRVEAATVSARSTGRVVPEVAGIIERVLVPALVSKYIAQLTQMGDTVDNLTTSNNRCAAYARVSSDRQNPACSH